MTSGAGRRVPRSVQQKRPAQVISAPPPGVVTGPLPPTPSTPGRSPFRVPRPRPGPIPRPLRGRRAGPVGLVALALLFVGLFCVGMGLGVATGFDIGGLFRGPDEPPPRAFPVLDPSRPERLEIPSLDVSAPILEVGLANDGSVDVPPLKRHNEAGWFDGGPTPGQFGPALIVGHADTRTGPSVFHDLHRMRPGQEIEVTRADGSLAIFEVNSVETFDKDRLPVDRVYGDYSRPSLRLMTCGGKWLGGREGYADNVIVFASLVDSIQG
ncbi:class F sortase [Actinoplanes sp. NPDC024001]|uniref:class F sortase n=1 Tax=Actinoplanes sp. NPDC024001 TaxID=3154598 RepID=UPI0033C9D1E6